MASSTKNLIPIIASASVGTIIEWYDFFIFGTLATVIATKFFPQDDAVAAFLATLATYAAGLVVRPFGALIFGRIGDIIGRKYTFMLTLLMMGGSTFLIGLVPTYESIGFLAPFLILILRLLQGLAIGGEYGGAATFVAEHSPPNKRGFWTSWVQVASPVAFLLSLSVILLFKNTLSPDNWQAWGWRFPFLISIVMLVISFYIRRNMAESPLFAKAKAEGKTSVNPLKESFGNKANMKAVLLALFGITMGLGVMTWVSLFYVQSFFLKTMFLDYNQANIIVIIALLMITPINIFCGWLSDKIGRRILIMVSLLCGVIFFHPLYEMMYQTTNLKNKIEDKSRMLVESHTNKLPTTSVATTTTKHFYTDYTTHEEVRKLTTFSDGHSKTELSQTITVNSRDKWTLILLAFLLLTICYMSFGPLAAYLVEMFPLKIRYTSLSFPYHVGYGIYGGMALVIATYLVNKAEQIHSERYYLAGLTYPVTVMAMSLMITICYLKEYKDVESDTGYVKSFVPDWVRRALGIVWLLTAAAAAYFGVIELGLPKVLSGKQDDIIFGVIVMIIITPVTTVGLFLFGKYSWQGEYDN